MMFILFKKEAIDSRVNKYFLLKSSLVFENININFSREFLLFTQDLFYIQMFLKMFLLNARNSLVFLSQGPRLELDKIRNCNNKIKKEKRVSPGLSSTPACAPSNTKDCKLSGVKHCTVVHGLGYSLKNGSPDLLRQKQNKKRRSLHMLSGVCHLPSSHMVDGLINEYSFLYEKTMKLCRSTFSFLLHNIHHSSYKVMILISTVTTKL